MYFKKGIAKIWPNVGDAEICFSKQIGNFDLHLKWKVTATLPATFGICSWSGGGCLDKCVYKAV